MISRIVLAFGVFFACVGPAFAAERASFVPAPGWHFVNKLCCSPSITLIGVWQENDTPAAGQLTFVRETTTKKLSLKSYVTSVTKALKVPITGNRPIALCDGRRGYELRENITTAYGAAVSVQIVATASDPSTTFYTATYARPADQPESAPAMAALHDVCIRRA